MTEEDQRLVYGAAVALREALTDNDWLVMYLTSMWIASATGTPVVRGFDFADMARRSLGRWEEEIGGAL